MGKLIKFELRKLLLQKTFYICILTTFLINIFQTRISWAAREITGMGSAGFSMESMVNAGSSFLFTIIIAVFAAIFICEDYNGGTIRVIITRGYTRTQIYLAKLIVLCIAFAVMLLLCWLSAAIAASVVSGGSSDALNLSFIESLLSQLLITLAYACLFNAVCSAIQKNGAAIALCIVLPLAVTILLTSFESSVSGGADASDRIELTKYWLDRMLSNVSSVKPTAESFRIALAASPIYIAATTALGWLAIVKREY